MAFRCPYCKRTLAEPPEPQCPGCGKVMLVPALRAPHPRFARRRALEQIRREAEQKKAALRGAAPTLVKSPKLYLGVVVVLAVVGASLFNASEQAARRRTRESPHLRAMRHVDVLAEALGRYRFHTGTYPTRAQGLAALVRDPLVPRWDGPYVNQLRHDPWQTPFVYEPPAGEGLPTLLSCGPDRARGTADDVLPDPARFDPGTAWTNGWVSAAERLPGVTVLPRDPVP